MAKATYWLVTDTECTKAWGANRIRYPGSPRPKRWILDVGGIDSACIVANAISIPPE